MTENERDGYVSVWLGTFADEVAFKTYLRETYDEGGNASCPLWSDLGVGWLDHDFLEAEYQAEPLPIERLVDDFSYMESFRGPLLAVCLRKGFAVANAAILVYDLVYTSQRPFPYAGLTYMGSFAYSTENGQAGTA
jgi:hypothetical protein